MSQRHLAVFNYQVIFSEALGLQSSALESGNTVISVARGALSVTPLYREVEEFRQAWNNLWNDCDNPPPEVLNNTWLSDLKDEPSSSSSDCTTRLQLGEREQMLFPWYHIQAAAVFAAAMKSLHSADCSGGSGACPLFLAHARDYARVASVLKSSGFNLEREFENVSASFVGLSNVRFDVNGEVTKGNGNAQPAYEVHNFRSCPGSSGQFCFVKVTGLFCFFACCLVFTVSKTLLGRRLQL